MANSGEYYQGYLGSRHWQELKDRYWRSGRPWECNICGVHKNLVLHHRCYDTLGREKIGEDVILLCQPCHHRVHYYLWRKTPLTYAYLYSRELYLKARRRRVSWLRLLLKLKPSEVLRLVVSPFVEIR